MIMVVGVVYGPLGYFQHTPSINGCFLVISKQPWVQLTMNSPFFIGFVCSTACYAFVYYKVIYKNYTYSLVVV